jgi:hypothetical protein
MYYTYTNLFSNFVTSENKISTFRKQYLVTFSQPYDGVMFTLQFYLDENLIFIITYCYNNTNPFNISLANKLA